MDKRNGKFTSRPHTKLERRQQNYRWRKKKRQEKLDALRRKTAEALPEVDMEIVQSGQAEQPQSHVEVPVEKESTKSCHSRGMVMVRMALGARPSSVSALPTASTNEKPMLKPTAKKDQQSSINETNPFLEINRALLDVSNKEYVGSGTFGQCFMASYRGFTVLVKEIKQSNTSLIENKKARREAFHEAYVLTKLGDHPGLPHLFGVCSNHSPYLLVLQYHNIDNKCVTLREATKSLLRKDLIAMINVFMVLCKTLIFIHNRGYLHNDFKSNNVVLEKRAEMELFPVVIDFGKSCAITRSYFPKPKVDVDQAIKLYPHIAPEVHRGERKSKETDVHSFGYMVKDCVIRSKITCPPLMELAANCTSSVKKRPALPEVYDVLVGLNTCHLK